MSSDFLFLIYGLCIMFYGIMAWTFYRKGKNVLSRLIVALMLLLFFQCIKDVLILTFVNQPSDFVRKTMGAVDMVVIPIYAYILIGLCHPGKEQTILKYLPIHELPFVVMPTLFIITTKIIFYNILVAWTMIYGTFYALKTMVEIPRYHARLTQSFSYLENINLRWLQVILYSFFFILCIWLIDCFSFTASSELIYLSSSLIMWLFISYFLYRHESVISELEDENNNIAASDFSTDESSLEAKINELFDIKQIYLNPKLKLSDVAQLVGSNRTYVSNVLNQNKHTSFYNFVNEYRVKHACILLSSTNEPLDVIQIKSGFNSLSTFHRVFSKQMGCTPTEYRKKA